MRAVRTARPPILLKGRSALSLRGNKVRSWLPQARHAQTPVTLAVSPRPLSRRLTTGPQTGWEGQLNKFFSAIKQLAALPLRKGRGQKGARPDTIFSFHSVVTVAKNRPSLVKAIIRLMAPSSTLGADKPVIIHRSASLFTAVS